MLAIIAAQNGIKNKKPSMPVQMCTWRMVIMIHHCCRMRLALHSGIRPCWCWCWHWGICSTSRHSRCVLALAFIAWCWHQHVRSTRRRSCSCWHWPVRCCTRWCWCWCWCRHVHLTCWCLICPGVGLFVVLLNGISAGVGVHMFV